MFSSKYLLKIGYLCKGTLYNGPVNEIMNILSLSETQSKKKPLITPGLT